jgi:hypothetical protein
VCACVHVCVCAVPLLHILRCMVICTVLFSFMKEFCCYVDYQRALGVTLCFRVNHSEINCFMVQVCEAEIINTLRTGDILVCIWILKRGGPVTY